MMTRGLQDGTLKKIPKGYKKVGNKILTDKQELKNAIKEKYKEIQKEATFKDKMLLNNAGRKAIAKYINLEVLHVSIDNREEVKPWCDACLVAQKPKPTIIDKRDKLEIKMSNLEAQMNEFLENI